jgi:DNA-binding NtrC family response regulator
MAAGETLALVLEDTELSRWALCRALEAEGFRVRPAASWAEASACLLAEQVGLALVAVSSVLGNVAEIVAEVCHNHPGTRLVLLADQESIDGLQQLYGTDADILAKPFDLTEVTQMALARVRPAG